MGVLNSYALLSFCKDFDPFIFAVIYFQTSLVAIVWVLLASYY